MTKQVSVRPVTFASIMRTAAFRRGLEEVRAGQPPCFDEFDELSWEYERGRQFAYVAPLSMRLWIGGKLNPKAIALFAAASDKGLIP
jgi:hypothetical protein